MHDALFSLNVQRYPLVIRAVSVAIMLLTWLTLAFVGNISLGSWIVNIFFALFVALSVWLVERYYVAVVFAFCFVLISLTSFSCIFLYILNSSPIFPVNLVAIALCGVLLGGRGATLSAALTLIWLLLGEIILLNRLLPAPPTFTETSAQVVTGTVSNTLVVLLGYVAVIFFAYVVRRGLSEISQQRDELKVAIDQLEQKHAREEEAANAVSNATLQLSGAAHSQAQGAQEQAAAVVQISIGAEHLDKESQLIADSAQEISELVDRVAAEAKQGKQMVDAAVTAQRQALTTVATTVKQSELLASNVRDIRAVLKLLADITRETHILSLNAAIEAAAAEDSISGRRFTVVAQEVEELASRAGQATGQVEGIINQVEQATSATVDAVEHSMSEVEQGVVILGQVSEAAERLQLMARDASASTSAILSSSEEQRVETGQVAGTMRQISHVAEQAAISAAQVQTVVSQLSGLVAALKQ